MVFRCKQLKVFALFVVLVTSLRFWKFLTTKPDDTCAESAEQVQGRWIAPHVENKRHVVVTFAYGYKLRDYVRFVGSLRSFYDGDIVVFADNNTPETIQNYCRMMRVHLETERGVKEPWLKFLRHSRIVVQRFAFVGEVCADYTDGCLFCDFSDVFFQANPFEAWPSDVDFIVGTEGTMIKDEKFNSGWIEECWGSSTLDRVGGKEIINAGIILATPTAMATFLRLFDENIHHWFRTCNDQGLLNYLVHTRMLEAEGVRLLVVRPGEGTTSSIGLTPQSSLVEKFQVSSEDWVLHNTDGSVIPIVHQYNRFQILIDAFNQKTGCSFSLETCLTVCPVGPILNPPLF